MLIYAGIDEAGYGPMLGPLCVACTVFVVEDHDPDAAGPCDLWKRLGKAVCRSRTDKRHRIAVEDSKKLKGPKDGAAHPLKHLERGVLAFRRAAAAGQDEASRLGIAHLDGESADPAEGGRCPPYMCCDLFRDLGVEAPGHDWYGSSTPLPVAQGDDELRIASSRLRTVLESQRVSCAVMGCEAIDAESFNRQVGQMGSKASVNFCAVLRLIDRIWRRWPASHPRVIVDRQGGRTHYLNDLMHAFPEASAQILAETDSLSRYRLEENGSRITISFAVEAEQAHLPVALASMTAKYVRELLMIRLNRYFQGMMPELKPTAGYVEDGRRYVAEIEPLIQRLGVDRTRLVRQV